MHMPAISIIIVAQGGAPLITTEAAVDDYTTAGVGVVMKHETTSMPM
jgi:hypothetical protein